MKFKLYDIKNNCFVIEHDRLLIGLNGMVYKSDIDLDEYSLSPYPMLELKRVDDRYMAVRSTEIDIGRREVWEGDIFECHGVVLKVRYIPSRSAFILETKIHPFLDEMITLGMAKEQNLTLKCIGNVLTHPELWEVAE